jgi:hypothetical protein
MDEERRGRVIAWVKFEGDKERALARKDKFRDGRRR